MRAASLPGGGTAEDAELEVALVELSVLDLPLERWCNACVDSWGGGWAKVEEEGP